MKKKKISETFVSYIRVFPTRYLWQICRFARQWRSRADVFNNSLITSLRRKHNNRAPCGQVSAGSFRSIFFFYAVNPNLDDDLAATADWNSVEQSLAHVHISNLRRVDSGALVISVRHGGQETRVLRSGTGIDRHDGDHGGVYGGLRRRHRAIARQRIREACRWGVRWGMRRKGKESRVSVPLLPINVTWLTS